MRKLLATLAVAALLVPTVANAWWESGHRLVGRIAWNHLTPVARKNVKALLDKESLADVAAWADDYRPLVLQTTGWHYTDVPASSVVYDRNRDCPTQPGVKIGGYNDKWRDCATDRILFFESRIADPKLDPTERAESLKFLVHIVGDLHQPFHASGVEKGGNGINVTAFGGPSCSNSGKCNLHNIWDGYMLEHDGRTEEQNLRNLESEIRAQRLVAGPNDPVAWTNESKVLADAALVAKGSDIGEAYYTKNLAVVDKQIELAGLRLASVLNAAFTAEPARFKPAVFVSPGSEKK